METGLLVNRRAVILLTAAFVITRVFIVWDGARPTHAGAGAGDMYLYSNWAHQVIAEDKAPYSDFAMEYPPGILPFIVAPEIVRAGGDEYRERFVALMVLLDISAFVALVMIGRRAQRLTGAWVWVGATLLLGPIIYLRLDLIPAVATVWAFERASAGAWKGSGAFWGIGIAAKLYPALLLPAFLATTKRWREVGLIATLVVAVTGLVYTGSLGAMFDSVFGYHGARGIQVESTWSMGLLVAAKRGYEVTVGYGHGAYEVFSGISPLLKTTATLTSLLVLVVGTFVMSRAPRDDQGTQAAGLCGLLAGLLAVGTVLSPQFIVWIVALAAVAFCYEQGDLRLPLLAVLPIAALTQLIYPYSYGNVVGGTGFGIVLLAARNFLLLGLGAAVLLTIWDRRTKATPTTQVRVTGP